MKYTDVIADLRAKAAAMLKTAERQEVSERMKRYWAKRRRERAHGGRP